MQVWTPQVEPMATTTHMRIMMLLDVHQHSSRIAEASFSVELSCDMCLEIGTSSNRLSFVAQRVGGFIDLRASALQVARDPLGCGCSVL